MHWSEVWHGDSSRAKLARTALTPLSWLYAAAWNAYEATYRVGLKRAREPHHRIACVGNLQVGGTGKTPFALYVAGELSALGREVVLSSNGYGSARSQGAHLAHGGELDPAGWGDEPAMIRWLKPELPQIVGRDRVKAAELCHAHYPAAVLLMDDGLQHLPLKKHITIVLDPKVRNRRCLPAGPYREPSHHASRFDLCIPGKFSIESRLISLRDVSNEAIVYDFVGLCASALCALARPDVFIDSLRRAGIQLETVVTMPDHDDLSQGNLFDRFDLGLPVIVTAKDWIKLRARPDIGRARILVAIHEVSAEPQAEFRKWLQERLL